MFRGVPGGFRNFSGTPGDFRGIPRKFQASSRRDSENVVRNFRSIPKLFYGVSTATTRFQMISRAVQKASEVLEA